MFRRLPAGHLDLARRQTQPAVVYITRLTGAAILAYLAALLLTGSDRPVLAPLTALLVVQASLFQTIRSAIRRVSAVTIGVLLAVILSAYIPFSWWMLGLLIAGSLALGMILRLGEEILEVPISAMLVFAVNSQAAATSRVLDTLVGAGAGLAAGLIYAPTRLQPAKDAVGDLTGQMSALLEQMAAGLASVPERHRAIEWLERTRALRAEIERVDDTLSKAEESIRLNPWRLSAHGKSAAGLRAGMTSLERAATDMRVLARSVADSTQIDSEHSPVRETQTRAQLASVLSDLSSAVRVYGELIESSGDTAPAASEERLEQHLEAARQNTDQLADLLRADPDEQPDGWPLRGEILAHVDRLRTELQPSHTGHRGATGPMRMMRMMRMRKTTIRPRTRVKK